MSPSLNTHQAFGLYGIILVFALVFFTLGLFMGKEFFSERNREAGETTEELQSPTGSEMAGGIDIVDTLSKPAFDEVQSSIGEQPKAPEETVELSQPDREEESVDRERSAGKIPDTVVKKPVSANKYTIQVAAQSSMEEARQLLMRLEAKQFRGRVREPDTASGDSYFRVWVGEFDSIEGARELEAQLKAAGFYTYVRKVN